MNLKIILFSIHDRYELRKNKIDFFFLNSLSENQFELYAQFQCHYAGEEVTQEIKKLDKKKVAQNCEHTHQRIINSNKQAHFA